MPNSSMFRVAFGLGLLAAGTSAMANTGVVQALNAAKAFAVEATPVVSYVAFAAGVALMGSTFVQVANAQRGQGPLSDAEGNPKIGPFLMRTILAALMIGLPFFGDATIVALFGQKVSKDRALSYAPVQQMQSEQWTLAWSVVIVWVVLIGVIGVFRGLLLWNTATTDQQGGGDLFWRGLWHIVGGAAAVNIGIFFV